MGLCTDSVPCPISQSSGCEHCRLNKKRNHGHSALFSTRTFLKKTKLFSENDDAVLRFWLLRHCRRDS
eukprot:scaffold1136_cov146-Cylindrotheca_fusiformis.AAC.26